MVSLVAQKFLSDVAYEALQHCKMRGGGKEMKKVHPVIHLFVLKFNPLFDLLFSFHHQSKAG